ncbi:MAG: hypothetical protein IID18_08620 [Nitrospinae bacterium]|nr:hypothetical protein [Nitrospinota bacterium]
MSTKRINAGWRAFSLAKETAYGTAQSTIDQLLHFEGAPADVTINNQETNENEITGLTDISSREIITYGLGFQHAQRMLPHNAALFLALAMGKVTSDQPDNANAPNTYRHYIERDLAAPELKSVTMIENDGSEQKIYPGIFCKGITLSGERDAFCKIEADLGGSGEESTDATGQPSQVTESYLRFGDVTVNRGGSFSGTVAAGTLAHGGSPTDLSAKVRSFSYKLENQANPVYEMGDQSKYVSRVERGRRWTHELNLQFELEDGIHHTGLTQGTEYAMSIPIVGSLIEDTFNYRCTLYFPKVAYREAGKSEDDGMLLVDAVFEVMEDATYGSVIVELHNKVTAYLT